MAESAKITLEGKTYEFPVIVGTEAEKAIDITNLRKNTSYITLDSGFGNTGSCTSSICYLDGEKGILRYRGIPIEQIAEQSTFVETAYLLIYGKLPSKSQLTQFRNAFTKNAGIDNAMLKFFEGYPRTGHPMAIVSAMVCCLAGYYPELSKEEPTPEEVELITVQLLAKIRTICAYAYRMSRGEEIIPPHDDLQYIPNFLHMMFSTAKKDYVCDETVVKALRTVLILHADHEQNCSTSTVRMVGSSWANLFASVSAGICALWGPLHGGANQKVVEMLEAIHEDGGNIQKYIDMAKDPKNSHRLMGFGHRVYKHYDPRAKIIKQRADALLKKLGINDPLLDIAMRLEEAALKDPYFLERKLYPNVDFYSGIIYKAIGIPNDMFPVMFVIGRLPGWIAHWREMRMNPDTRIGRPRQVYIGEPVHDYVPISKR